MSNQTRLDPDSLNAGIAATILAILAAAALTAGLILVIIHHSAVLGIIFLAILTIFTILVGAAGSGLVLLLVTMAGWLAVGQHVAGWRRTNRKQETTTPEEPSGRRKVLAAVIITLEAIAAATGLGVIATLVAWSIQDNLETLGINNLAVLTGLSLGTTMGTMIWLWGIWSIVEEEYRTPTREEA